MSGTKVKDPSPTSTLTTKNNANHLLKLQNIFKQSQQLAWELLDAESLIYSETDISIEKITNLTTIYMRIIEKLNTLQDPREQYFSYKMQKLMSEPYIIRSFSNQHEQKKSALEARRRLLEQKIEQQAQRQNHKKIVQQTLQKHCEKEERVKSKIKNVIQHAEKRLEERIKKRATICLEKSLRSSPFSELNSYDRDGSATSSGSKHLLPIENSDFEQQIGLDEQERFNQLKREVEDEQREQQRAFKILRLQKKQE